MCDTDINDCYPIQLEDGNKYHAPSFNCHFCDMTNCEHYYDFHIKELDDKDDYRFHKKEKRENRAENI